MGLVVGPVGGPSLKISGDEGAWPRAVYPQPQDRVSSSPCNSWNADPLFVVVFRVLQS